MAEARQRRSRGKNPNRLNFDKDLVAAGKCGRASKGTKAKPYCTLDAGWGTKHVGKGACRKHGGNNPIATGEYSETATERLGDSYARFRDDPKIGTIEREIAILRCIAEARLEAEGPSADVADLMERVVRAVDSLLKHRQKFGISIDTLNRVAEQMGVAVARHVKDPEIRKAIERDWDTIQLDS